MNWINRVFSSESTCSKTSSHMEKCEEERVSDVGILGLEFYFPRNYVSQQELEKFDGVSAGNYTEGYGQLQMSFCGDNEDVCSLAMTVTSALLKNYDVDPAAVGYLEVGTETLIDKSKSVKSVLMDLFPHNADLEGADVKNACYGGTQALFHAVDWLYANYDLDGRLAIVVCVDIAIYAPGKPRSTGGAGAIAFLVGPGAPLVLERGMRACYATNVYDFYKPVGGAQSASEYPLVNGTRSVEAYLTAIDATYAKLALRAKKVLNKEISLQDFHAVLFHSPFTKLTQKALARMAFHDFRHNSSSAQNSSNGGELANGHANVNKNCDVNVKGDGVVEQSSAQNRDFLLNAESLEKFRSVDSSEWFSRAFTVATIEAARPLIAEKLDPYTEFSRRLGNMYTPSLYAQLIGAIYKNADCGALNAKRFLLFSYGSGCIAAMFSLRLNLDGLPRRKCYEKMRQSAANAHRRLDERVEFAPEDFVRVLETRECLIQSGAPYTPRWPSCGAEEICRENTKPAQLTNGIHAAKPPPPLTNGDEKLHENGISAGDNNAAQKKQLKSAPLFPGTFYLNYIDEDFQRFYQKFE